MFKTDKNKKKFLFGKRFNEALMILYALAVILPVSYDTIRGSAPMPPLMKSLSAAVLSLLMVLVCLLALRAVRSLHLPGGYREQVQKDWIFFGVFFIISFGVLLLWYIGYCPGFFSVDSQIQMEQAVSGIYRDKHPVLHTFTAFTIPLKMTNGCIESIIFFQILFFSLVTAYMGMVMLSYAGRKVALLCVLFLVLNPVTGKICLYPWKDVAFAIWSLLLMTFAAEIYFSDGQWLNQAAHTLVVGTGMALEMIIRHNGILFVLPLLTGVLLYADRKRKIWILLVVLLTAAGI